ncbi:MAG: RnfABCDGE type electron transport complex subunit C [Candidatus Izemoplasmatales bacterium]
MLLRKSKGLKIEGRKSMSKKDKMYLDYSPKFVYIHLLQQNSPLKRVVEVGESVKVGQTVALREGFGAMPIHASISGTVTSVKKVWHSSGKMVDAIEIESDGLFTLHESIQKEEHVDGLSKEDLVKRMQEAGLSGLGGAGFPTYVKYQSKSPIDTIIVNAVECEPYLTCDYALFQEDPEKLLRGLSYSMKAAGASKGYIAYKGYNHQYPDMLEYLLKKYPQISLFPVADVYPSGWEKYIVEHVINKTYTRLPGEAGVIVDNLATVMNFADVVEFNHPLTHRAITITGEGIKNPRNYYVPIGTKVSDLIQLSGGYIEGLNPAEALYIAGGPMTGRAILIDDLIVNDTLGAVIVKPLPEPKDHPACLGCGRCSDVCPVFLAPTEIQRTFEAGDMVQVKELNADKCIACGLCSHICPSHIEITEAVVKAKTALLTKKGA